MHWFIDPITKHYADFDGRVGRQEFWMFVGISVGIQIILDIVGLDFVSMILALALLVPSIALGARRLHDTGRSGWWQLLALIPIIGWIILIVWCAEVTTPADNQYGTPAKPKVVAGTAVPVEPVVVPTTTPSATADETVVRDADIVSDKTPQ